MNTLHTLRFLAVASVLGAAPAFANLLVNPSFESDLTDWNASGQLQVQTNPGDLTSGNSTFSVGFTDGSKAIAFNNAGDTVTGVISQTFATSIGQEYEFTFDFGLYSDASGSARLRIQFTGSGALVDQTFTDDSPVGYNLPSIGAVYSSYSLSFVADSASTTLTISDVSVGMAAADTALDNLSVTAIPEPSSAAALAGVALLGFAALRRRRA